MPKYIFQILTFCAECSSQDFPLVSRRKTERWHAIVWRFHALPLPPKSLHVSIFRVFRNSILDPEVPQVGYRPGIQTSGWQERFGDWFLVSSHYHKNLNILFVLFSPDNDRHDTLFRCCCFVLGSGAET